VWNPQSKAYTIAADFAVTSANGITHVAVNQNYFGGRWLKLGDFRFNPTQVRRTILSSSLFLADVPAFSCDAEFGCVGDS
jgi:hypothetical protein